MLATALSYKIQMTQRRQRRFSKSLRPVDVIGFEDEDDLQVCCCCKPYAMSPTVSEIIAGCGESLGNSMII